MMFDQFKDMAGLAGIMKDLPKMKAQLEQVKARLGDVTAEAQTGGGAVRARANGRLEVTSIEIDQALLSGLVEADDPDDRILAQDLIVGAVNGALIRARELAEKAFAEAASEMGLPVPPGGLEGLLG
jgi:DNA-binding protein YbaB